MNIKEILINKVKLTENEVDYIFNDCVLTSEIENNILKKCSPFGLNEFDDLYEYNNFWINLNINKDDLDDICFWGTK